MPEDWLAHPDTVLVVSPAPQPSQAQPGLVLSLPVGTYCRPMPSTLSSPLQLTPSFTVPLVMILPGQGGSLTSSWTVAGVDVELPAVTVNVKLSGPTYPAVV